MESRTQGLRPRTQKKSEARAKDSLSEDRPSRGFSEFICDESQHVVLQFQQVVYYDSNNNNNNNGEIKRSSGIYTASKQRKARTKTTLIRFLLSRSIRSLCNTTHSNERYVPITGYSRQNYTRTKYINSVGHHRPSPQNDEYDGRQSPQKLPSIHISRQRKCGFKSIPKTCQKKTRNPSKTAT